MDSRRNVNVKVSIGLPVFNGEKFIRKRIESIQSQTLKEFELIISDNASIDDTSTICKEFASKDNRIRYFRQKKNIGMFRNFKYVLDKAQSEYFVWAAVDDIWLPEFLEENIKVLENDKNSVGSISKIELDVNMEYIPGKYSKKIKYFSYDNYPVSGSYEDRVEFYLRVWSNENIYAIFRTAALRTSFIERPMGGIDKAIILNVLKYGEIQILDKVLMIRYSKGFSRTASVMEKLKHVNGYGFVGIIFPLIPFTFWCAKNLGMKIFLKNLDYFLYVNYAREKLIIKYLFRRMKIQKSN